MVTCSCGKTIDRVPTWLNTVNVEFVCNNCPNRSLKNIAIISAEIDQRLAGAAAPGVLADDENDATTEEDEE